MKNNLLQLTPHIANVGVLGLRRSVLLFRFVSGDTNAAQITATGHMRERWAKFSANSK
jgi:hypothetical protein